VLEHNQLGYVLLSEASLNRCKKHSITICPADTCIQRTNPYMQSELFFQNSAIHRPCLQKLLSNHQTPFIHRYETSWIFYFPTRHRVSLHCRNDSSQVPSTLLLYKAGIIHHASQCYVTSNELQTFPELHTTSQTKLDTPNLHVGRYVIILHTTW